MRVLIEEYLRERISTYYKGKFWKRLIKDIKNKNSNIHIKSEDKHIPYINKPGIAFSFDDSFRINDWYKYGKDLFGFYDVKVTFNINAFHHFEGQREHTQKEIDMLIDLQSKGHEIAHHGFKHENAVNYSNEFGLNNWVEHEIKPLFKWIENQSHSKTKEKFKKPVTYSFPYVSYTESHILELVSKYFKVVRGGFSDRNNLVGFNHTGYAPSIGIDEIVLSDVDHVKKILRIAKELGMNVIFMCHSILPDEVDWNEFGWEEQSLESGKYRISPKTIQDIIDEAKNIDLEFYTTSEIAGVATFIDRNMESSIREIISNPLEQWIAISELSKITELDLSGKNISNLDGIQYFLNLEKLNLSNNQITDFRLLEKLPKLKKIDLSNNLESKNETFYHSKKIAE